MVFGVTSAQRSRAACLRRSALRSTVIAGRAAGGEFGALTSSSVAISRGACVGATDAVTGMPSDDSGVWACGNGRAGGVANVKWSRGDMPDARATERSQEAGHAAVSSSIIAR